MNIKDIITRVLPKRASVLIDSTMYNFFGTWLADRKVYASLIWYNICDILLDLTDDVKLELAQVQEGDKDKVYMFAAFRSFFYAWGHVVLQRLKDEGYVVIGWDGIRFWQMNSDEYSTPSKGPMTIVQPFKEGVQAYVMRDATYISRAMSDRSLCQPWLDFLDDICNGSATVSNRLGAVVIASPKTYSGAPTPSVLTEEQKKKMETDMEQGYGALGKQHQIMVLPKEMAFQVVSLAQLDLKFADKVRECVLAIADRLKVPANQIALIDANSSKSLSNGSELREGDKAKYKSFRRLFERTFMQMAMDFGMKITYAIDGEPHDDEVVAQGA